MVVVVVEVVEVVVVVVVVLGVIVVAVEVVVRGGERRQEEARGGERRNLRNIRILFREFYHRWQVVITGRIHRRVHSSAFNSRHTYTLSSVQYETN